MVSASSRAASSGSTVSPPLKLKPCRVGMLQESGLPTSRKVSRGSRMSRPMEQSQTGKLLPVSSWRRWAQRRRPQLTNSASSSAHST
ncbi:hypothetical protein D3C80_1525010 [compost metagenome]